MKRTIARAVFTASLVLAASWVAPSMANELAGKKVLFVDSYHEGYAWSDGIAKGIHSVLDGSGAQFETIHMDTKRNKGDDFNKSAALKVKEKIEAFNPDVVIACDHNASKHVIVPFYVGAELPFVFCGVNGTAEPYGFPASNVTGMVEVEAVKGLTDLLSGIAGGTKAGFIGSETTSSKKKSELYEKELGQTIEIRLVKNFDDFKKEFVELQKNVDYVIVDTPSGIDGWDDAQAEKFVHGNTKKPTGTFSVDVVPFIAIGFMKQPEEQGEWAANAAKKILSGTPVSDIPVAQNERGQVVVNSKIVDSAGIKVPYSVIEIADQVM